MKQKEIINKFVKGNPITFGDSKTDIWKDTIKRDFADWCGNPLEKSTVQLDFSLADTRFMGQGKLYKNDLDNLAKPVLDALVKLGVLQDDSGVLDLTLRKRKANGEGVLIKVCQFSQNDCAFD